MSKLNRRHFVLGASLSALQCTRVLGANDRIGVAVVGCGMRGLLGEVLQFSKDSNIEVAGVCDIWKQQRENAAEKAKKTGAPEPKSFADFHEVLASPTVDAVLISTPDHQHCTQLSAAVKAKKDVYVEKPLAMNMKELISAVDTVKRSDRIVQCGTQVRSWAPSAAGRAFVSAGGLGKIFKIEQSRNSFRPYWDGAASRKVAEDDTNWKAFLMHRAYRPWDEDQYAGWMAYREFSRGPHTQFMAHFVDLLHFVTGAKYPQRIMAMGGTFRWKDTRRTAPDSIEVVLEYKEGFIVRYNSSFGTNANSFLKFIGSRGTMDATKWSNPWLLSGDGVADADRIAAGATIPEVPSTPHMKNWFDCMRSRQQPAAPIETGYGHSVACIMADESFLRGRRMVHDAAKRSIYEG
jgi:predicted dehydrogenase